MSKHKRIKALPVCSETLRRICDVNRGCTTYYNCHTKEKNKICPAYPDKIITVKTGGARPKELIHDCDCYIFMRNGRGCPHFRKAVDK